MKQLSTRFLILLFCLTYTACSPSDKTGYINITKVYGEIKISEKYKAHLQNIESQLASQISEKRRKNQVKKDAVLAKKNPSQKELEIVFQLQNELDSMENYYSKAFNDSSLKYNEKVKDVVNELVYQYGMENNYTYLFSPASSNSFMYADSTLDRSDQVIEYINKHTN